MSIVIGGYSVGVTYGSIVREKRTCFVNRYSSLRSGKVRSNLAIKVIMYITIHKCYIWKSNATQQSRRNVRLYVIQLDITVRHKIPLSGEPVKHNSQIQSSQTEHYSYLQQYTATFRIHSIHVMSHFCNTDIRAT